MTTFENKCGILGKLWLDYRQEEEFQDFIEYNDLGLPLAYMLSEEIVKATKIAETYVAETWDLFLGSLDIADTGFQSLDEILGLQE